MIETRFKDTEVGRIPEDWEEISLGDVGEVKMCKRIMKYQTSDKGDIPFYKIGTFGKSADAFISKDLYESFKSKYNYPKKGDILLSAAGTIGRTVVFNGEPSYFQDSNIVWIENDEHLLSNALLYYIYKNLSWVTESGTIPRIYNSIVKSIKFCIPVDKSEQIRIATALSNIDTLISELGKLIEKKRAIKQGAMQQLLTGKKRLRGFTEPWVEKKMGDCANVLYGFLFTPEYYTKTGKYKVATIGNVQEGKFYPDGCNNVNISSSFLNDYQYLKPGDLLISMTGNVGRVCIINAENYVMNYRVGKIVVNSDLCLQLLFHLLNQKGFIEDMLNKAKGAAQLNISKDDILSYSFLCPKSISEQTAIASVLSSMDEEISSLEAKREKYFSIKQGMMQQLLTGKIRLID